MEEEEFDLHTLPNSNVLYGVETTDNVDAVELPVTVCKETGLPKNYKLTNSQKVCASQLRGDGCRWLLGFVLRSGVVPDEVLLLDVRKRKL